MLFDPKPKECKKDLFDREKELSGLERYVRIGSPLILCIGIRRSGKTSLIRTFINEYQYPALYLDARKLADYGYSKRGFIRLTAEGFSVYRGLMDKLKEYLQTVKGITVSPIGVEFDWRGGELSISSILEKLNEYAKKHETAFLVVIDEAQELRFLVGNKKLDIRKIIAWSYDTLRNIKFIITGSEVGVLYGFLGFEDPKSPLYGRARDEIVLDRFPGDKAVEFLEAGFSEAGIPAPRETLLRVTDILDGIPGWLALYGYTAIQQRRFDVLKTVFEEAVATALSELSKLKRYSELYAYVLKSIATDCNTWSCIKSYVEARIGRTIANPRLYYILRNLMNVNIIAKEDREYVFLDPIYREASKRL